MRHHASQEDVQFRDRFESCQFPAKDFDHQAHLRLAYIYLTQHETDTAYSQMRKALFSFLAHIGVDKSKYHDTITRAWVMAVRHFMEESPECNCAGEFIARNQAMLDSKIMLSHYSAEVLFSDEAREQFVEPDIEAIPKYDEAAT